MPCSTASSRADGAAGTSCGQSAASRSAACLAAPRSAFERVALLLVGADALPDRVERPAVELGCLRAAAADQFLDHGTERAVAAGPQHGIAAFHRAGAGPFFATAATAPVDHSVRAGDRDRARDLARYLGCDLGHELGLGRAFVRGLVGCLVGHLERQGRAATRRGIGWTCARRSRRNSRDGGGRRQRNGGSSRKCVNRRDATAICELQRLRSSIGLAPARAGQAESWLWTSSHPWFQPEEQTRK